MAQRIADAMVGQTPADVTPGERGFWLYVALVAAGGPAVALGLAVVRWDDVATMPGRQAVLAGVLVLAAAAAGRFRIPISYQVHVNVSTAASVAMLILLPLPLPGLLAPLAKAAAEFARGREERSDPAEIAFNVGQSAWCAVAGALAFAAMRDLVPGTRGWLDELSLLLASAAGFAALHAANTGVVAGISALQRRSDPVGLWWASIRESTRAHATMAAVAFAAAVMVEDHALTLAALVLPLALVHRAVRASAQLRDDTHAALQTLVEVVELRDPYTAGHSRRVAETARALALWLGMTPEEADNLESAGRVHDIGKVAIDPAVLTKPGKLDPAEWAEMRRHPELGAEVIARFAAYREGHRLVRHHHEAWDGTGYPDGLAGETIPFGARILAVADTFDALTSDRPYRPRMELDRALAILADGAGRQWDTRVVEALFAHVGAPPRSVKRDVPGLVPVPASVAA